MNADIIKLREETGGGVMECKRALEEAGGDFEKAVRIIQGGSAKHADKKKERSTGAGFVYAFVHNNRAGTLLEVRCETDFVAKSEPFQEMVHDIAMHITGIGVETVEELLTQPFVKDASITIKDVIDRVVARVGENIKIERFVRYEI
jgi:elongation factor Ts